MITFWRAEKKSELRATWWARKNDWGWPLLTCNGGIAPGLGNVNMWCGT